MEFKNISSSQKAISDLNRLFGITKVKAKRELKSRVIEYLRRSSNLSKKVFKILKSVVDDSDLISDYVATVGRFTVISEKIINKLEDSSNVKENSKTS